MELDGAKEMAHGWEDPEVLCVLPNRSSLSKRFRTVLSDEHRSMRVGKSNLKKSIDPKIEKIYVSLPSYWVGKDKNQSQQERVLWTVIQHWSTVDSPGDLF